MRGCKFLLCLTRNEWEKEKAAANEGKEEGVRACVCEMKEDGDAEGVKKQSDKKRARHMKPGVHEHAGTSMLSSERKKTTTTTKRCRDEDQTGEGGKRKMEGAKDKTSGKNNNKHREREPCSHYRQNERKSPSLLVRLTGPPLPPLYLHPARHHTSPLPPPPSCPYAPLVFQERKKAHL